ncbi:hypothetical protein FBT96_11545 [Rhodobacter capsulatus]|uniref:Uncharacterized protein n=1 Tax=Rhodobacter capsulatus TaxID=1061 RepID=A0A4U1JPT4_RHOCA|nr:hypothetical protein [Rhodobacter capsulatus]TKD18064.1 hypothetical protein FBT96_11545 [Rhodobacter capsulatus]
MEVSARDIPPSLQAPLAEALALCGLVPVQAEASVLLLAAEDPAQALARIADFAASRPEAGWAGADRIASGQVVWLLPEGQADLLRGALARAALRHAPQLRVNAIHLAPRRPAPAPWQAAWTAAAQHPGPPPLPQALAQALALLLQGPALTGQVVNVAAHR